MVFRLVCLLLALPLLSLAGELTRDDLNRRFPPPLHVGEKLQEVPAWPITSELSPDSGPLGYVFESVDLAPIPGFEGTPFNLLISVDTKGDFLDVEVLRQHEPVFLSGLGPQPLNAFVTQYKGHNLKQEITVASLYGNNRGDIGGNRVVLDGVSKATASIRIVNQTVLTAALAVARARLGFAAVGDRGPAARVKTDFYQPKSFTQLLADGDIVHRRWTNREVEALFAGTEGAGLDETGLRAPEEEFVDVYVAYASAPTIGRALLGEAGYIAMLNRLDRGQHAYWVATAGRHSLVTENFVRGTTPQRLAVGQDSAPLELRDVDLEPIAPAGAPAFNAILVLKAPPLAGMDPSRPVTISLDVSREKGLIAPIITHRALSFDYQAPSRYFDIPPRPLPEWLQAWRGRIPDLLLISCALTLLSAVLARPRWMTMQPRRQKIFRLGFLTFTLVYVGWHAQGQLSIVQITGAVKSLATGQGLASFLYDPVSLLLIVFTLATFVIWGRGTFCGWLCPFGAMQEFIALMARRLGLKKYRQLPPRLDRLLDRGRYVLLALLVITAAIAPALSERLVEVEPFKTSITVGFDRSWPFVAYAVALLLLSALYYKFFCRYLCPLGAAIALGGRLRRIPWLVRRAECGRPCQSCRYRCHYDAITKAGAIDYDKCFQCLDCVGIYHDAGRCAPLLLKARKGRTVLLKPVE
ncbi:MAG: 4Fe-4S binding protein [Rhodocyclaceae bacterium]|nr:MAG: 4Fe-4S binding protein [Rhodocyclaceae bacterium]